MNERGWRRASAKSWIVALSSLCWGSGCWDAPPTYEPQQRIPPFVIVSSVRPAVDRVVQANATEVVEIYVPFRSEDLGEEVVAAFGLDGTFQGRDVVGASVFEDSTRTAEFQLALEVDPGCYLLSMVLTHDENYQGGLVPVDESQAAYLYWWVDVTDPRVSNAAGSCPGEGN